jgi:hypothetical protein
MKKLTYLVFTKQKFKGEEWKMSKLARNWESHVLTA